MPIRRAGQRDFPAIRVLAARLGLDYEGMENDRFWTAEEDGRVVGIVGLKEHFDSRELVSLGVDPDQRSRGLGRILIEALASEIPGDIYLATIIPGFFERCGFMRFGSAAPAGMKKEPTWCEGCPRERCTIMVRRGR